MKNVLMEKYFIFLSKSILCKSKFVRLVKLKYQIIKSGKRERKEWSIEIFNVRIELAKLVLARNDGHVVRRCGNIKKSFTKRKKKENLILIY